MALRPPEDCANRVLWPEQQTPPALRACVDEWLANPPFSDLDYSSKGLPARISALLSAGRTDLSLARLLEGHVDAVSILDQAGRHPAKGTLYGIWASGGPQATLTLQGDADSRVLTGSKPFCSGADLVDVGLLHLDDGSRRLVSVDVQQALARGTAYVTTNWISRAFEHTRTATLTFVDHPVNSAADLVGAADWYFRRPGFWQGALGPAACWAGGGIRLVDYTLANLPASEHAKAHAGAMVAESDGMRAVLTAAAQEVRDDPADARGRAHSRALITRFIVERACSDIRERFGRIHGPRPFAMDAGISRHIEELGIYLRQNHAERDQAEILAALDSQQEPWT